MVVSKIENLKKSIDDLQNVNYLQGQHLKQQLHSIYTLIGPVYNINKILPKPIPIAGTFNTIMDETILETALSFSNKFKFGTTNSIMKNTGNNILDNAIKMIVKQNSLKIKVYSLAILKNILK